MSTFLEETWRPVIGYEGYYDVSDFGRVRSVDRYVHNRDGWPPMLKRGQIMKQSATGGYLAVNLHRKGQKMRRRPVHLLVIEAFQGERPSPSHVACHCDGDRFNNENSNLRWDTRSANAQDAIRHGTHPQKLKTHCPQGHEYTTENTSIYRGGRKCKTCVRARDRHRRQLRAKAC